MNFLRNELEDERHKRMELEEKTAHLMKAVSIAAVISAALIIGAVYVILRTLWA